MPWVYLDPTEYVAYGLTAETSDDWVEMASALIEAHCRRQSLLVTQYVERMRLTAGSQAVRLSYLPLTPLGEVTSALVGVRVRYGRAAPRRVTGPDAGAGRVGIQHSGQLEFAGLDQPGFEYGHWRPDIPDESSRP